MDAFLVTGDIVQDDPGGYVHFRRLFSELGKLVYLYLGYDPHQIDAMRAALASEPFRLGGYADFNGWRIVLLDSCLPGSARGHLAKRPSRLDSRSEPSGKHALVCLHHHPVAMSSRWLDQVGLDNATEFFDVIDRHKNVRAIVWGHVHQSYDGLRKNVRLLATPSTCAQFLPRSDEFAVDSRPPAYRTLELKPDGTLVTEVVWVDSSAGSAAGSSSRSVRRPDRPMPRRPSGRSKAPKTLFISRAPCTCYGLETRSFPRAFDRAYADSTALVMEIDMDDLECEQAAAAWMMERGVSTDGATLRESAPASRCMGASRRPAGELGLPIEGLQRFRAVGRDADARGDGVRARGLRRHQAGVEMPASLRRASTDKKAITGLETLERRLGALDGLSLDEQRHFLQQSRARRLGSLEEETRDTFGGEAEPARREAAGRAADERVQGLSGAVSSARCSGQRNKHWMPQIEKLLREKDDYLVVVGALHLVGEDGLLQLARARAEAGAR